MAEGFLKSFDKTLEVHSAGSKPEKNVNPNSIAVMHEEGLDISRHYPKDVKEFQNHNFDFVITVCDNAKKNCPAFTGNVKHRIHLSFVDPADAKGTQDEVMEEYREVRDEIKRSFRQLYNSKLKKKT